MNVSKRLLSLAVIGAAAPAFMVAGVANAASVSLVNSTTTNTTLNETVAVPIGSNASIIGSAGYGAAGYVFFGTDVPSNVTYGYTETGTAPTAVDVNYSYDTGNIATLQSLPSWLTTTTSTGTVGNISMDPGLTAANYFTAAAYGYPAISIIGQPAAGSYPTNQTPPITTGSLLQSGEGGVNGTTVGTLYKLFDIALGAGTPSDFRLGLMTPQGYDASSQLQVSDGSASASVNIDPAQNLGYYIFNISGAVAGDTLVISAATSPTVAGGYFTHNPYGTSTDLVGMTFDVPATSTPEPASVAFAGIGGIAALMLVRRSRRLSLPGKP